MGQSGSFVIEAESDGAAALPSCPFEGLCKGSLAARPANKVKNICKRERYKWTISNPELFGIVRIL